MVRKEDLNSNHFRCVEFPEERSSFCVRDEDMISFHEQEKRLAVMIAEEKATLAEEYGKSSSEMSSHIAASCQIAEDTLKKTITGKIPVTRRFLYKFTVGLKMSPEKADEYFALCGGKLTEDCLADFICLRALQDGDEIFDFLDQMNEYASMNLYLRERADNK